MFLRPKGHLMSDFTKLHGAMSQSNNTVLEKSLNHQGMSVKE